MEALDSRLSTLDPLDMRIVFVGPPGAGKGTQAQRLKDYLGVTHLSTGDILREADQAGTELGRRAAEFFRVGKLVPDHLVVSIVAARLAHADCLDGYLFDGFPRTVAQAQALDAILGEQRMPLDVVLSIEVPSEEIFERLAGRGRQDDEVDTIRERLDQYHALTEPILAYYSKQGILRRIDGTGTPDQVFERIRQAVEMAKQPSS